MCCYDKGCGLSVLEDVNVFIKSSATTGTVYCVNFEGGNFRGLDSKIFSQIYFRG